MTSAVSLGTVALMSVARITVILARGVFSGPVSVRCRVGVDIGM